MRASLRFSLVASAVTFGTVASLAAAPAAPGAAPAATPSSSAAKPSGASSAAASASGASAASATVAEPEGVPGAPVEPEPAETPSETTPAPAGSAAPVPDDMVTAPVAEPSQRHGSQVASSEWLPITIGGGAGLIIGVIVGQAVDPSQPVVFGPIAGGVFGALTGGGAGAWLIRGARGEDTRLAGAMTGLGLGASLGASIYAHTDSTVGKIAALVLFPAAGALAGHRLAFVLGGDGSVRERRRGIVLAPSAVPLFEQGRGATGLFFGVNGVIL
jgi:hypothetical protein